MPDSLPLLVFDLGKVFVDFDYQESMQRLAHRCNLEESQLYAKLINSPLFQDYERGIISTTIFFKRAKEITGFDGTFDEFASYFTTVFRPIEPMINLHRELKKLGYKTCLFSNTNEMAINYFNIHFPFINEFDWQIFSYQRKSMKPEEKIYRILEVQTGFSGNRIVYLDDIEENIQTGIRLGWRAFVHQDVEKTRRIFIDLNLLTR
ncbi:MAG: HAD family hydrolase [Verrucomicrobiia bacterium]